MINNARAHRRSKAIAGLAAGLAVTAVTACSPGGSNESSSDPSKEPSSVTAGEKPTCGSDPVTMKGYFETGFPLPKALTDEFTTQFPNVTWDIREDQFAVITQNAPRVLADDPPDLMRLPSILDLANDDLLLNLDGYATAFGWDDWPASQLEQLRVSDDGTRGDGSLYAMGLNFSLTGVFYNKALAEQVGMTEPPQTLDELDQLLASAKDQDVLPIQAFNGGATGGLAFPLQNLMADYSPAADINDWIFQKPDATIDTDGNREAVSHLNDWIEAGYFAEDVNSVDYSAMMSRFIDGEGLFMFDGDWESGNLDKQMPGEVGFFLMPPLEEGGAQAAMSAPLTFGVAAGAEHPDCAAFFLDWVATNDKAREIGVEVGGSHPMGLPDAFMPEVDADTVTASTLEAGAKIGSDNGAMDFIANATGAIYAKSWTPQLQKLVGGEQTPEGLLASVQEDYEDQVGN